MATATAKQAPAPRKQAQIVVLRPVTKRTVKRTVVLAPKPPALKAPAKGLAVRAGVLQAALVRVERVAPRKSTLPILGYALLEWARGKATLSATDLEAAVVIDLVGTVARGKGAVALLPKAVLATLTGADGDTPVTVEVIAGKPARTERLPDPRSPERTMERIVAPAVRPTVRLVVGSAPYRLGALDAADFPAVPDTAVWARERQVPAALLPAYRQVLPAAADDDSRPVLAGVYWSDKGEVVAADGFRLHRADAPKAPASVILPARLVKHLVRHADAPLGVALGHRSPPTSKGAAYHLARFRLGVETWYIRLIEGQFPDYQKILPREVTWTLIVDRAAWLALCERARAFAPESNLLRFEGGKNHIAVSFKSGLDDDSARIEMEWPRVAVRGLTRVALNLAYLKDALARCATEQVVLAGYRRDGEDQQHGPVVFRDTTSKAVLACVMPMQVATR